MKKFNLKSYLKEGKLHEENKTPLNENAPGYDTRKSGGPLPTLDSVREEYEKKSNNEVEKESIHEGKKSELDKKLAEIDKEGRIVTLEAKIAAIGEAIDTKTQRITTVTEDADLSELVDKKRVKEMQKEIKLLEKQKAGFNKMLEKINSKGKKKKEIVDEDNNYMHNANYTIN
jgi:hypothetical protein